jgi:hypothetical protein
LRLTPRYWREIELHGGADIPLARRAAKLFSCDGNLFIFAPSYLNQLASAQLAGASRAGSTPASVQPSQSKRYRAPQPPTLALVPQITPSRETSHEVAR